MWSDQRLCQLLGIEHPIVLAPMAGTGTPELAIAVSNAGGLGSLGCGMMSEPALREATGAMRAGTNLPFNLNFFATPAPAKDPAILARARERLRPWYRDLGLGEPPGELPEFGPGFDDAMLAVVLELRPRVVSFHFGVPGAEALAALKEAGIVLISTATNVAEARALEAAGMDAVIAQGWEAGGHRGSHRPTEPWDGVGTFALVPQIADAVSLPVIAAGGVGDGRGIAAAMALGASGVQIGTGFLACPEAGTDPARRALLRKAGDMDTIATDAFSGGVARAVRSRYAVEMERRREPWPAFPAMAALSGPIGKAADDAEASFHLYGQAAALSRDLPAAELVEKLVADAGAVMARLAAAK
ncbi:NAD(P)H-dependent flavin oxidoreductase [Oceanibacterium hippocampi]|uniref:Nitronate monooxygenase n=1 Tax=Oceanibacterium hippocampi TaxID=745714 RepID=A0A1Y5SF80_9PROT|nr:nitronate monooxygenase [Oceanibacterium hippocampi]SLN36326.1 Nitronate monooxygenase [Oceanibacterium hippocampi]